MFVQHKQELVPSAGNVRLGLPGKISISAVHNEGGSSRYVKPCTLPVFSKGWSPELQ